MIHTSPWSTKKCSVDANTEFSLLLLRDGHVVEGWAYSPEYAVVWGYYEKTDEIKRFRATVPGDYAKFGKRVGKKINKLMRAGDELHIRCETDWACNLREHLPQNLQDIAMRVSLPVPSPVEMVMAQIPAGSFQMGVEHGRRAEMPAHPVHLSAYEIGVYQVTQQQYFEVTGENPSFFFQGEDAPKRPVESVNWYDALAFCNLLSLRSGLQPVYRIRETVVPALWGKPPVRRSKAWDDVEVDWTADGYRLPTEAEWEYAARGGANSKKYAFAGSNHPEEVAWFEETVNALGDRDGYGGGTQPVGQKKPNELGLYDMSGNVWEWCFDWQWAYRAIEQFDPHGEERGRLHVFRGGSWNSHDERLRTTYRRSIFPYTRFFANGFRVARSLRKPSLA